MFRLMRMCAWNAMRVWISYRSFSQKWNFISGDKISCKHYPKWNAYTCPSKYRVVLKCSRNETSCEQNLFSRRFEISNRYEFISLLMWTYSKMTYMYCDHMNDIIKSIQFDVLQRCIQNLVKYRFLVVNYFNYRCLTLYWIQICFGSDFGGSGCFLRYYLHLRLM